MKKIVALLLTLTLTLGLTACGGGSGETANDETAGKTAVDVLTDVWTAYEEEEKFSVGGGTGDTMTMDAPGAMDAADGETLDAMLGFPAASAEKIDDAASLMHMMMQNNFTAAAYHVTNAEDVQGVAEAIKENMADRQWMCGFPEQLVIYTVGTNYVVAVFGAADLVEDFDEEIEEVFESTKVVYEGSLEF